VLANGGQRGPFASYAECEAARAQDEANERGLAPGNLGGTTVCEAADEPETPGGRRLVVPFLRFQGAAVFGSGWTSTEADGTENTGSSTIGFDFDWHGGNPILAAEASIGIWNARLASPHFGDGVSRTFLIPFVIGFSTTAGHLWRGRKVEIRPDLGLGFAFLYHGACSYCGDVGNTNFGYRLQLGLDFYFGKRKTGGIGVGVILTSISAGDIHDVVLPTPVEIRSPPVLVQIGIIGRNPSVGGW
jgi:hypothetical protein